MILTGGIPQCVFYLLICLPGEEYVKGREYLLRREDKAEGWSISDVEGAFTFKSNLNLKTIEWLSYNHRPISVAEIEKYIKRAFKGRCWNKDGIEIKI